jgi:phosphoribosylanthranilate isomerase
LIQVKVCGLTRPQDVASCLEFGVDRLGFVLAPSPRQVSLSQLDELLKLLPPGCHWSAVLVNADEGLLQALLERGCGSVQFHGDESAEWCRRWSTQTHIVKAFSIGSAHDLARIESWPTQEVLLDGPRPGSGQPFSWQWLQPPPGRPFWLAGGLNPDNVEAALRVVRPLGVDVSSGVESAPSCKCRDRLQRFVERVRAQPS